MRLSAAPIALLTVTSVAARWTDMFLFFLVGTRIASMRYWVTSKAHALPVESMSHRSYQPTSVPCRKRSYVSVFKRK
jgi:hypothetical protein